MRLSRQGCPQELWQCHHPSLVPSRVSAKAFPQALRFIRCVLGKKPSSMSQCRGISPDPAVGKGRNPSGTIRIFPEITEEEWITSPDSEHEQSWTPPHPLPHHLGQSRHQNLITKDWTPSHKAQPLSKRLSWAGRAEPQLLSHRRAPHKLQRARCRALARGHRRGGAQPLLLKCVTAAQDGK